MTILWFVAWIALIAIMVRNIRYYWRKHVQDQMRYGTTPRIVKFDAILWVVYSFCLYAGINILLEGKLIATLPLGLTLGIGSFITSLAVTYMLKAAVGRLYYS